MVEAQPRSKPGRPPHPPLPSLLGLGVEPEAAVRPEGPFREPNPPEWESREVQGPTGRLYFMGWPPCAAQRVVGFPEDSSKGDVVIES